MPRGSLIGAALAITVACGSNTTSVPTPANCSPSSALFIEGRFDDSQWRFELQAGRDGPMLITFLSGLDLGGLGTQADNWLLVEGPTFFLLSGTVTSRDAEAVVVMPDGRQLVLCAFGGFGPAVVGGLVPLQEGPMMLEVREGDVVISQADLAKGRELADSPVFALATDAP